MQLLAVFGVCFNHWSITLLKGLPGFFSGVAYREPAMFGLVFLFMSSGFLIHSYFSRLQDENDLTLSGLDVIASRFWRLLLPVLAAVAFDYLLQGFSDQRQTMDVPRALPFLLTLTQTWYYKVLGATSLAEPSGGSNMAWLGADLFFLVIFYGITFSLWNRIRSPKIMIGIVMLCMLALAVYLKMVLDLQSKINIWSTAHYGADLANAYQLSPWLIEYNPYVHLPAFIIGIMAARFLENDSGVRLRGIIFISLIYAILIPTYARYLGLSLVVLIILVRWSWILDERSVWYARLSPGGLLDRLGSSAYEVYVLHLVIYHVFTLSVTPNPDAYSLVLVFIRLVAVNLLVMMLCVGFTEKYFMPWEERIVRKLGFLYIKEVRHV